MANTERTLLLVSGITGVENLAKMVSRELGLSIQIAKTRRAAAAALRREAFTIVLVDSSMPEGEDPELLWQRTGLAIPMEMALADVGASLLLRQLRSTLARREHEAALARRAASHAIEDEMRQQVTGLLLQSELLLLEKSIPPTMEKRVMALRTLADGLRTRLRNA